MSDLFTDATASCSISAKHDQPKAISSRLGCSSLPILRFAHLARKATGERQVRWRFLCRLVIGKGLGRKLKLTQADDLGAYDLGLAHGSNRDASFVPVFSDFGAIVAVVFANAKASVSADDERDLLALQYQCLLIKSGRGKRTSMCPQRAGQRPCKDNHRTCGLVNRPYWADF